MYIFRRALTYLGIILFLGTLFWFSTFFSYETKFKPEPIRKMATPLIPMEKFTDFTYQEKLRLMLKDQRLEEWFSIEEDGISMFNSPWAKTQNKRECKVFFSERKEFLKLFEEMSPEEVLGVYKKKGLLTFGEMGLEIDTLEPEKETKDGLLSGWKIALDPGHMGGSQEMAELEGKFVKIKEPSGDIIKFNEGNLNLVTVLLLREKLEELGATVMLTRSEPGITSFGMDYDTWLADSLDLAIKKALATDEIDKKQARFLRKTDKKNVFHRFFKHYEFMERARRINAFAPDLTLIVHYNVDEENFLHHRDDEGNMTPSKLNYSMAFVPGSFMEGELEKPEARLAFLRLLLSEGLKRSVLFSNEVCQRYDAELGIPSGDERTVRYLGTSCIAAGEPGVYARNLALTRLINSPMCYGEGLFQDNRREYLALSQTSLENGDPKPSKRIEEVAETYFQAILAYAQKVCN
ncbi:hypothetical protein R9C00_22290 [Flammeovirgaceae bacterium SG7u.111]|nr:hypothetical protein [Flammeovirgaceae bacterium SG7u.132]WPO34433.1 hypothetical protein R9C00_22290 [Flammeovirgaceae bacterium SG7u.111]